MKNFFEQQDRARKITRYLIFLFVCAIAGITLLLYTALLMTESKVSDSTSSLWHPVYFAASAAVVCLTVGLGSAQKTWSLRGGGPVVAASLGGQRVIPETADPQAQVLLNVVSEMAIAASIPQPKVYVLPDSSINAFAAGHALEDAVVAVTKGTLEQLTRDELQGVVGHEFSHILNGDMALNVKLIGWVHGLLLLHTAGRRILFNIRSDRSSKRDGLSPIQAAGIALLVGGGIGWIFGQLIKSAVSRQREFLADAAAVQFTRNPEGLTNALRRIAANSVGSQVASPNASEASHLFFSPPTKALALLQAFATHPPLEERIRRLGGQKISKAPRSSASQLSGIKSRASTLNPLTNSSTMGLAPQTSAMGFAPSNPTPEATLPVPKPLSAQPVASNSSQSLLTQLPGILVKATRSQVGSAAIVYSLLLSADERIRIRQNQLIATYSPAVLKAIEKIEPALSDIGVRSHLPLIDLCIPALTTLAPSLVDNLLQCTRALIKASGSPSLSHYTIRTVLQYRLSAHFLPPPTPTITDLRDISAECLLLIAALARVEPNKLADAEYTFRCGHAQLPKQTRPPIPDSIPSCSLSELSKALKRLQLATPKLKKAIADACAYTVLADGRTTDSEAALLRAILIAIDRPLPAFVEVVSSEKAVKKQAA